GSPYEPSLKDSFADSLTGKDQIQPEAFLTSGADLRNNLIDLLRPVEVYTTEDSDEEW
nr:beta-peptide=neuropeptide [Lymnaea stagnalis=freshwater snails, neurons VD1/RPD2, Peptide, 57 aa] [Lymnaea stagnalis]prf//2011328C pro-hormone:ISOTYPE=beta [Lymnaea stagnalis]